MSIDSAAEMRIKIQSLLDGFRDANTTQSARIVNEMNLLYCDMMGWRESLLSLLRCSAVQAEIRKSLSVSGLSLCVTSTLTAPSPARPSPRISDRSCYSIRSSGYTRGAKQRRGLMTSRQREPAI
jgi:hypothetical protein